MPAHVHARLHAHGLTMVPAHVHLNVHARVAANMPAHVHARLHAHGPTMAVMDWAGQPGDLHSSPLEQLGPPHITWHET